MAKPTLSIKFATPNSTIKSKGTLFFLSGYPDRHNTFMDTLVPELSKEYSCIVACMPDYDQSSLSKFMGYGRQDILEMIDNTVESLALSEPITLILHDWGSYYGVFWYAENQSKVSHLICLDVFLVDGLRVTLGNSLSKLFLYTFYQWWLIAAFLTGRIFPPVGNLIMLALYLSKLGPDLELPPASVICPPKGPRWYMCYPYFHFWWEKLVDKKIPLISEADYCPVLYAYGTKKRFMFHSQKQIERMSKNPKHKILEYDCGHWIQHAKAADLIHEIKDFLQRK